MTYSVIGSGNIGGALARQFSRAGVNVTIADRRGADTLAPLVQELGDAIVAGTIKDAVQVDIIFLVLPFAAVETFGRAKDQWRGKIVIDATNAYHVRPELLAGRLSSDIVAAALPGAAVVKAFNHLPAAVLAQDPSQNGGRRVVFISSNDDAAANEVKILAEQLGFSPILLGRIDEAGRLLQIDGGLILHNLVEWPFKERNRGANAQHCGHQPFSLLRRSTSDCGP
jgi:predicted dinucleotide-binding enzyme